MSERFSEQLRHKLDGVWQALHDHPFVRGVGAGTLEEARFQVWLRQDYLLLLEYARFYCLAAARAPDLETTRWGMSMAQGVLHGELLLHHSFAVEFGIAAEDLEAGGKLPTTLAYTNHLLRTAALGSYLDLVAALLPCVWVCAEVGQRLARQPAAGDNRYLSWVEMYSGPVVDDLARRGRRLLDHLARQATPAALATAEDAFALSCRYHWLFWEMCYQGERWPVQ
jgi:thiaminase/transcriptional activator TenA